MADGSHLSVRLLKKGDKITTPDGPASILCVLKYSKPGTTKLCTFPDGLNITPRHPIMNEEGLWVYPSDLVSPRTIECSEVYNLILDKTHIAVINGIKLITIGHNYKTGILAHEYLGSKKIVEDLEQLKGWEKGVISFG